MPEVGKEGEAVLNGFERLVVRLCVQVCKPRVLCDDVLK